MEKEFVIYELALRMKQLGFDEPCMAYYVETEFTATSDAKLFLINRNDTIIHNNSTYLSNDIYEGVISAPTWQSAFRWFREKYQLHSYIEGAYPWFRFYINSEDDRYESHKHLSFEESEMACLEKLIEVVDQSKTE